MQAEPLVFNLLTTVQSPCPLINNFSTSNKDSTPLRCACSLKFAHGFRRILSAPWNFALSFNTVWLFEVNPVNFARFARPRGDICQCLKRYSQVIKNNGLLLISGIAPSNVFAMELTIHRLVRFCHGPLIYLQSNGNPPNRPAAPR